MPVQVGKRIAKVKISIQGDDEGENISSKQPNYSEVTALYWAWRNLKNYEYNKNKIQKRLIILKKLFNTKITGRIGPVFPIPLKKLKNVKKIKKMFLIRHKISKNNMSKFHKCVLLPVHFNITDNQFKKFLNILIKNLKK